MKLNHINLVVYKAEQAISFFEKYFNFSCTEIKGDHIISVLKGEDGFTLVLMKSKSGEAIYPENFHIGFMLENPELVTETYKNLKTGGISVGQEPKNIRDSFGFYFHFENILIEVGYYLKNE